MGFLLVFLIILACYLAGIQVQARLSCWLDIPVILIASALLAAAIQLSGFSYAQFWEKSGWLHEILPVLVVALAIPFYRYWSNISRYLKVILALIIVILGTFAWLLSLFFADQVGLSENLRTAVVIKSITTPVALLVGDQLTLDPFIVVGIVMITGMIGAVLGPPLLKRMGVIDHRAVGLALGVSSHAIGTARAFRISQQCGAYAAMGLALNGIASAVIIPWLYQWVR